MTPEEKAVIEAALYLRYCIDAKTAGDPPRIGRLLDAVEALIFSCPECNAGGHTCFGDGNPIGHTQTDCGEHEDCDNCAPLSAGVSVSRVDGTDERTVCDECGAGRPKLTPPIWTPAALIDCLAGDRVRMMGDHGWEEADVLTTSAETWHVDNADPYRPKRWDHVELYMSFSTEPDRAQYPPNTPCEILCTPARAATLTMQKTFPGSAVIS